MIKSMVRGKARSILLVLLLSGLAAPRASAQEGATAEPGVFRGDSLEMAVKGGFGKLEVGGGGSWFPFRITLWNQGPPISGRLVVRAVASMSPGPKYREFTKEIQLPTGSRQFHEIAAYLTTTEDVEVLLMSGERIAARTTLPAGRGPYSTDEIKIAVLDTDPTALNNITSAEIIKAPNREPFNAGRYSAPQDQQPDSSGSPPPPPGQSGRRTRRPGGYLIPTALPFAIQAEDLPRDMISYDSLDALVIGDAPLDQLVAEQSDSLKMWVGRGGLLIVTGAADFAGLRSAGLSELLPIEPLGSTTVSALTDLTSVYSPFESKEPLVVMGARVRPGARTLIGEGPGVVVAESHYGSGTIRFLAFNPKLNPYRGWASAKELWADMLLPSTGSRPKHVNWITGGRNNSSSSRGGAQDFLFSLAEIEPTSPTYFLAFLLLYIIAVGPLNYLVLRWRRKTDLAWITIPAVVILFTVVSLTVARLTRGGTAIAADVALVELHQRDGVASTTAGLLIMPASKDTHEMTFSGPAVYAHDLTSGPQSSSASVDPIEYERDPARFHMRVPMTTWTSAVFQVRSTAQDRPPIVSASPTDGQAVTIKNVSGANIAKAVYLSAGGVSEVFDLESGEQRQLRLSNPEMTSFVSWYESRLGEASQEASVFRHIAPELDRSIGGEPVFLKDFFTAELMSTAVKKLERPLLVCFSDESSIPMSFGNPLKRRSKSLYVVHL